MSLSSSAIDDEERRRVVRNGSGAPVGRIDRRGEIGAAVRVVLHDRPHHYAASGREPRNADPVRIEPPLGGMLADIPDCLPAILFGHTESGGRRGIVGGRVFRLGVPGVQRSSSSPAGRRPSPIRLPECASRDTSERKP